MIPQPQCELNPGTERRGKALLGLGGAARNGGQHETLVFEDYEAKGRADRMFRSAGETAPGSWHDLPCSPPSFTNWQNFLVGMLAPLKVHCGSQPACQSLAPMGQGLFSLKSLSAWKPVNAPGHCAKPDHQGQHSARPRILPPFSGASSTSPCFAVPDDGQKNKHTTALNKKLFFL